MHAERYAARAQRDKTVPAPSEDPRLEDPRVVSYIRSAALVDRMSNAARKPIELPDDLQAFAEEQVRAGKSPSVADVVREALEDKKLAVLREALDVGVAELDAGKGVELSPEELMDEVFAEVGLEP